MNCAPQSQKSWTTPPLHRIFPFLHPPARFYPNSTTILFCFYYTHPCKSDVCFKKKKKKKPKIFM
ncbi:hypothetical protein Hanom_Chr06g00579201 [Helianthus anomalus]